MAKEAELKRVDLKVSVDCCEGCKRKVLKALSIKGVLRTEIHPTIPKVTVIGNVDVGILIKKLSKVGKSAEVLAEEKQKPHTEDSGSEEAKRESDKSSIDNGKDNKSKSKSSGNKDESRKDKKEEKNPTIVETTKSVYPTIVTAIPHMSLYQTLAPPAKVYYPVDPIAVPVPYYAMNANPAPATYYIQDYRSYETPSYRPSPPQSQAMAAFGDYFNEDNTVGCRIM